MDVILKEDFPALGYVGDHVNVKAGYARNFLIPRGIAVEGSSKNARELEHRLAGIQARRTKLKTAAETKKQELEKVRLEFTLKIGSQGKSFGSISTKDIQEAFAEKGHELDRKQVRLLDPIKSGGSFNVEVKLHSEVSASVPIEVTAEVSKAPVAEKPAKKRKKGDEFDIDAIEAAAEDAEEEASESVETSEEEAKVEE